ncbi:hypothetical protein ABIF64_001586 [Bradyrhizobium japonicum]|jgi:hypothetical protein|uniref:Uncharacterized protein n=1 Tax=Bradyrhizobium elkanii TaxID=29448 RepID=A0ABV4FGU4_BRAEL|nr:hypothetical protein [Bradyrhizobium elkanii]MCP1979598.1 hypothetical protein [Bradyrhizobium elkanii]MCS3885627.1 hypothetical protein [Bradyrhizobium elkanii]MCS4215349.1 hypothetical protein [Bradyrhizobium elkanii]MCW2115583.1 hypothetical protein [Bradyrhizobium elkanii]
MRLVNTLTQSSGTGATVKGAAVAPAVRSFTCLNEKPRPDNSGAGRDHKLYQYIRG